MKIIRDKGIIESASAPTSADVYRLGTIWVDKTTNASYILVDVTAGVATWDPISNYLSADYRDFTETDTPGTPGANDHRLSVDSNGIPNLTDENGVRDNLLIGSGWTPAGGMKVDGVDDYILTSDSANLDFGNGDGSIELYFSITNVTIASQRLYSRYEDASNTFMVVYRGDVPDIQCTLK